MKRRAAVVLDAAIAAFCVFALYMFIAARWTARDEAEGRGSYRTLPPIGSRLAPQQVAGSDTLTLVPPAKRKVRGALVFLFREDCPACALQRPDWLALATSARLRGYPVIAIAMQDWTSTYHSYFNDPALTVVRASNGRALATSWNTALVPTTMLVGATGVLEFGVAGILNPRELGTLDSLLELGPGNTRKLK